jgi:hypothetical protein
VPPPSPDWIPEVSQGDYRRRLVPPFLARFREADPRALFRVADLRLREAPRALFRAVRRPPFLAALARLADRRALFLAPFRAAFLAVFLRRLVRVGLVLAGRLGAGSSKSPNEDGVEAGGREGVLSIGSGSIHPEPDQPISM